ncbi:MAG: heme-binding protein, partial [Rhodobiaceae bacterium]|nr:heme-binding protein [Rhodobiaceae bacterium]
GYYAVIKYSGRYTNQNHKRHSALLTDALNKDSILIKSNVIKAAYNGPFTPFFLRRNESMYRVEWE